MERLIMVICIASISFSTPSEQANPYPLIVLFFFLEIGVFPSGCSYRIMTMNRDGLHFLETRGCVSHRAQT